MRLLKQLILILLLILSLYSCSMSMDKMTTPLHLSSTYFNYLQPNFQDYIKITRQRLNNNRTFISDNHEKELSMNMPFELGDKKTSQKAILLVHGLGDSPYSFSDIAISLENQGFYVQVILLPGHGSKPKDLMLSSYLDWQTIVDHYAGLLKNEFSEVWLGGFSTGGNLVTIHAIENTKVNGLMLFSPGFQSRIPFLEKFGRLVSLFTNGVQREENNLAKYTSSYLRGAVAYTDSAFKLRRLLKDNHITIPTLIAISELDSVVDSESVKDIYLESFHNSKNKVTIQLKKVWSFFLESSILYFSLSPIT